MLIHNTTHRQSSSCRVASGVQPSSGASAAGLTTVPVFRLSHIAIVLWLESMQRHVHLLDAAGFTLPTLLVAHLDPSLRAKEKADTRSLTIPCPSCKKNGGRSLFRRHDSRKLENRLVFSTTGRSLGVHNAVCCSRSECHRRRCEHQHPLSHRLGDVAGSDACRIR